MKDNLPQLTEEIVDTSSGTVSPVDYIHNSIKIKAANPSLLEKIDGVGNDADYFSSIFNETQEQDKVSFNEDRINIDEAYTKLSDGTYVTRYDEGFTKGSNNEQIYAEGQSTGSKWINGLGKFVGKTAVNVVGGTIGTAFGAISAVAEGNWERVYDNGFYDFLDDQNTKMDNFAANYRTQEEGDMGFFESTTTANFWADDFLGGMSFMTGTVISEALWATATGGASLSTTASRVGLRASKYFNTAKQLSKGVKEAQSVARKYNRLDAVKNASSLAVKYGKAGEVLNLARFTYTGAGFESGMEARMYQKEQRENFNRDFEKLNGRKPDAKEIAEFESNLNETTNFLWVTNMALVGTSNLAILGKTFGISSPFKLQSKSLNKAVFGIGETTTVGKAGERISSAAISKTKLQRGLGFAKAVFKNPFYEGFVEEGGQASASSAMEGYLTSRYNPSEDAMGIAESMYEGFSHTYGTKQGWKEVGLGALIGLVGGEASNVAAGQGLFTNAKEALKKEDSGSTDKAENLTENAGTKVTDRIFATKFEENLAHATELQDAQKEFDGFQDKGSLMGMANSQGKIMLTSVKNAVDFDYLEDQIKDFEVGLRVQDPAKIAEHFGIEENEVDSKIDELITEYKNLGDSYKSAKEFADYVISDNPKELFEDGTPVDVRIAKTAMAFQMVMAEVSEKNMEGAHEALIEAVSNLSPQLAGKYTQVLSRFNEISKSKKEDVQTLAKAEKKLKLKQIQLERLNKQLLKLDQTQAKATPEGKQKDANKYNALVNKITEVEESIITLTTEVADKDSKLVKKRGERIALSSAISKIEAELDMVDPLIGDGLVSQITLEDTQKSLEELEETLKKVMKTNPQQVALVSRLGKEYRTGLEMWQRNADTVADLTDPDLGLKRLGTLINRKKTVGTTTLNFLKKLQKTQAEELEFSEKLGILMAPSQEDDTTADVVNEQQAAEDNIGEDITQEENEVIVGDIVQDKITELKSSLKKLVGENSFVLENFTDNAQQLAQDKAPTQGELDEYTQLRNDFKSGDINKLVGRPLSEIGKRTKERSGLSDKQIERYQELSQKMLDWRIVTGTNSSGVSIQDILEQIEAYEQELQDSNTQVSAEQVLEMADQGQKEFSMDKGNPDYVNSMDKVNIHRDSIQTTISHLAIKTVLGSDFKATLLRKDNRGTISEPDLADVYLLEKDGNSFEIQYTDDHHRILIPNKSTKAFLDGMGMQTVKYNTKTGWGYVFKDGIPMQSDFGINLINNPEINILNPNLIYDLQPGDTLSFTVNVKDIYNSEVILPLIEQGKIEEATKLMSVYTVNNNGDVVGFLKSGVNVQNSNFNKVREEAMKLLLEAVNTTETTLEDLANDNTNSVISLPFIVKVEKTFVGTPNIELESDGSPKIFKINEEQYSLIEGVGYAEKGKTQEEEDVRKTFIPKETNTPYVVIRHGNTKVAFPVGIETTESTLQDQVLEILNSDSREPTKITSIISLLKESGIEPAKFNLDGLKDNSKELERLLRSLNDASRAFTKEELKNMPREDFLAAAEIVIDLNKPAFVSPKVKMTLSKSLIDTRTSENTTTKKLTKKEKQDLIIQHSVLTARAKNKEEVADLVMQTGDEIFIKEFLENTQFKNQVIKAALASKVVPSINTNSSMESILQDVIDISSEDIPLDIQEKFSNEIEDLKNNPSKKKIEALAKKVAKATENRYKLVSAAIDTKNLYHIPTSESEQQMFDQNYVRVTGDFYKKIDKKYSTQQLLEGLYSKYKNNTLPSHMMKEYLSLEDFVDQMPNTLLDIYKLYYNSQPTGTVSKKATVVGNEQYLREDFKGDFADFIQKEKNKGSKVYKEVLQHFQITDKGILKDDLLTRDKIDQFEPELGPNYRALMEYSLINKHIDLQATPQKVIFVEDIEDINRLEAVNNPNLFEPKTKALIVDDKTIAFERINPKHIFIKRNNSIYEQVNQDKQGDYLYEKIANVDADFLITSISPPFNLNNIETKEEIDRTKTNINTTDGREIDC